MSNTNQCRLCKSSCIQFKNLFCGNSQKNKIYEIANNYFNSELLTPSEDNTSRIICMECWQHINDFYNYQHKISLIQTPQSNQVKPIDNVVEKKIFSKLTTSKNVQINIDNSTKPNTSQNINKDMHLFKNSEKNYGKVKKRNMQEDVAKEEDFKRLKVENDTKNEEDLIYEIFFEDESEEQEEHPQTLNKNSHNDNFEIDNLDFKEEHLYSSDNENLDSSNLTTQHSDTSKALNNYTEIDNLVINDIEEEEILYTSDNENSDYNSANQPDIVLQSKAANNDFEMDNMEIIDNKGDILYKSDNKNSELISSAQHTTLYTTDNSNNLNVNNIKDNTENLPSLQSNINYSSIISNDHIEIENLDITDIKEEILYSSDDDDQDQSNHDEHITLDYDTYVENFKGSLECPKCKRIYTDFDYLKKHFELDHPLEPSCHIVCCEQKMYNIQEIVEHRHNHHNRIDRNTFKCEICGASFSQYGSLRRHIRKKHAVSFLSKWYCTNCKKTFKTRAILENHKKLNHTPIIRTNVQNIKIAKTENKPVEKSTKTTVNLNNPTPSLKVIEKKFNEDVLSTDSDYDITEDYLQNPVLNDTRDYNDLIATLKGNLKCPLCKSIFAMYTSLEKHFKTKHPTEETCYIICCQIILRNSQQIVEHLETKHAKIVTIRCDKCIKTFKNERSLASHNRQVHMGIRSTYHLHLCYCKKSKDMYDRNNDKYDTEICCARKATILENDAVIAKWQPELICQFCKAKFPYYSLMSTHFYYEHPGEKYSINCCNRQFKLCDALDHIRIHLDPFYFRCDLCNMPFSGRSSLTKHKRLVHSEYNPDNPFKCDQCSRTFQFQHILTRHKNIDHTTTEQLTV